MQQVREEAGGRQFCIQTDKSLFSPVCTPPQPPTIPGQPPTPQTSL